jgi:hypothetical protein
MLKNKNLERQTFRKVKQRKTRDREKAHLQYHSILITFQLLEFLFLRDSTVKPNSSHHFLQMNCTNLEISTISESLSSFLLLSLHVCWKTIP